MYSLEQVLVEVVAGREHGQTVGHEQPTTLCVRLVLVFPRLVTQLTQNLIPQLLIGQTLSVVETVSVSVSVSVCVSLCVSEVGVSLC